MCLCVLGGGERGTCAHTHVLGGGAGECLCVLSCVREGGIYFFVCVRGRRESVSVSRSFRE